MTLENYVPRKGDRVLIEVVVEDVISNKTGIAFDGGLIGNLSVTRVSDVVKLVQRKETPEEEIARLKEENAKWQKLAEEFREKCEKLEKFAPSLGDWMGGIV